MTTSTPAPAANKSDRLYAIVRELEVGMLTTVRPDGTLHTRPMVTRFGGETGVLWFFTTDSSAKAREVAEDRHVAVAYADAKRQIYAAVAGSAAVVHERARMEHLWSPLLITWFPKGLEDPDLALLRVNVRTGEYWDAPSSTMIEITAAVQSALQHPPPVDSGENEKVQVKKRAGRAKRA